MSLSPSLIGIADSACLAGRWWSARIPDLNDGRPNESSTGSTGETPRAGLIRRARLIKSREGLLEGGLVALNTNEAPRAKR